MAKFPLIPEKDNPQMIHLWIQKQKTKVKQKQAEAVTIHHNQGGLFPGLPLFFNIRKVTTVIHPISKLKVCV